MSRAVRAARAGRIALVLLVSAGCREVVVACAADGTCPAGRSCVDGICRPLEGDGLGAGTSGADAADGAACTPGTGSGPTARSGVAAGIIEGKLIVLGGDEAPSSLCTHHGQVAAGSWRLSACAGWSALTGTQPPTGEGASSVTWTDKQELYVYGGRTRTGTSGGWAQLSGLWRFSAAEAGWKKLAGGGPPGRTRAGLGVEPDTGALVMFGGDAGASDQVPVPLADVWRYDQQKGWKRLNPAPGPARRYDHAAAVSRDGRYLAVFGGLGIAGTAAAPLGDTWRLDIAEETWAQVGTTAGAPSPRHGARLLQLPGDPRLLLFGGRDGGEVGHRNDLWLLDPASGLWQLARPGDLGAGGAYGKALTPAKDPCERPAAFVSVDAGSPPRRRDYAWGWDTTGQKVWLFGGRGDCGPLADVWTLRLGDLTWAPLSPDPTGWSCARQGKVCDGLCPTP